MSTEPTLEVLDVEVTPLPSPLRLAQPAFLASLKECETQIAALKITDAASAQLAATLQSRLTTAGKMLEDTRKKLKAPVLAQGEAIDNAARAPAARISALKSALSNAQIAYAEDQQRIAAKKEQERQAELARLEKIRLAEEAEAKRKTDELAKIAAFRAEVQAAPLVTLESGSVVRVVGEGAQLRWIDASSEAAATAWTAATAAMANLIAKARDAGKTKAAAPVLDLDDDMPPAEPPPKTETEKQIEAIQHTPAVVAAKPLGVAYKVRLVHKVESVAKLPDCFVIKTPNDAAIRATYCAGWSEKEPLPVVPGVVFTVEKQTVSTGKAVF